MISETVTYCNTLVAQIKKELDAVNDASDFETVVEVLGKVQRKARNLGRICGEVKLSLKGVA